MICAIVTLNLIGENEIERVDRLFVRDVYFCYILLFVVTFGNSDSGQKSTAITQLLTIANIEPQALFIALLDAVETQLRLQCPLRRVDTFDPFSAQVVGYLVSEVVAVGEMVSGLSEPERRGVEDQKKIARYKTQKDEPKSDNVSRAVSFEAHTKTSKIDLDHQKRPYDGKGSKVDEIYLLTKREHKSKQK